MKELYIKHIASLLSIQAWQVENCAELFSQGDTIPFISRYRKEATGGLDDAQIAELKHYLELFDELEKRKVTILKTIEEAGALSDNLRKQIEASLSPTEIEDLYLPYRPKRRTRATAAREKGLEPLADSLWALNCRSPRQEAQKYISDSVASTDEALAGARDIIAERISEDAPIREDCRAAMRRRRLCTSVTKAGKSSPEAEKYRAYFDFSYPISKIPSHNLLAALRAESEGYLKLKFDNDPSRATSAILNRFLAGRRYPNPELAHELREAIEDSYKRLLEPSISSEVLREAKQKADEESIRVFGENLRQLLLGAPVGQKRTMAIDPGYRNGCKIACLDEQGSLLYHTIIYPHPPQSEKVKAIIAVQEMIARFRIEAIAVGNGTASRETSEFLRRVQLPSACKVWTVSEDGASIYSASEIAREEFPNEDVTVRGAVSIGRRLMDPLSELVKIDPKSLGIGQYQHDVDQSRLKEQLDNTVESCVNLVGVQLNTASPYLLAYVAGIGPSLAAKIVEYRSANGAFASRAELLKVPRLGAKAFEQCAGFLRISGAANPLDNSAVHPESYHIVDAMAASLGSKTEDLVGNKELIASIKPEEFVCESAGLPTIKDILSELAKPGRDPRESASEFSFDESVRSIEELRSGMELPGIVSNITNFGAFVDIGLHENGLIHVSKLGPRGTDPSSVLKLHQQIKVRVADVDLERRRIALELIVGRNLS